MMMPQRKSSITADKLCCEVALAIDDGTATGTFLAVACLRSDHVTLDNARVRIGGRNARTRTRPSASFARVALDGLGVLADEQGDVCLQRLFLESTSASWRVRLPGMGTLVGPFRIARLNFRLAHAGMFDLALGSTGPIEFETSALIAGDET